MPDNVETLDQIYAEIAAAHERLADALASADAKTVLVVGYALGASAFLATQHAQVALAALAYAALSLAVAFGVLAYRIRDLREVEPRAIFDEYYLKEKADLLRALAATRVTHYEHNKNLLNAKVGHWWRSLSMLVLGTVLLVAGILVHTGVHDASRTPARGAPGIHHSMQPISATCADHACASRSSE